MVRACPATDSSPLAKTSIVCAVCGAAPLEAPVNGPGLGAKGFLVRGKEESGTTALGRYMMPFNVSGVPALVQPCGFSTGGLPIGLQWVGRPFDEATVLRTAAAFEGATEWHLRRPDLG